MSETSEAFFKALKAGDAAGVERMAAEDPGLLTARSGDGLSPVMTALYWGRPAVAEALVAAGVPLDFHEAAAAGQLEAVEARLESGVSIETLSVDGHTALGLAAFFGREAIVRLLLARGASANSASTGALRTTPLIAALAGPRPELARLLVEAGADVNARGNGGFTPLHQVAQNGQPELAALLLERGADPDAAADDGKTPLDLALDGGHGAVAAVLRRAARLP